MMGKKSQLEEQLLDELSIIKNGTDGQTAAAIDRLIDVKVALAIKEFELREAPSHER